MADRDGLAHCHQIIGHAHHHLGDHTAAVHHHGSLWALFHDLGDQYREAGGIILTGDAHHSAGDEPPARAAWTQALTILELLGHQDITAIHARLNQTPVTTP